MKKKNYQKIQIKLKKLSILLIIILFSFILESKAESKSKFLNKLWLETWSDTSYRSTNFGVNEILFKEKNFFLTYLSTSLGIRLNLSDHLFLDPYFKIDCVRDWFTNDWNNVYWNNSFDWGFGCRIMFEFHHKSDKKKFIWTENFSIDFFIEYLNIVDSPDNSKARLPVELNKNNFRSGVTSWWSISSKVFCFNFLSLWGEMWSEFSYESTNFSDKGFNNFFILNLNPAIGFKMGLNKISLQPYFRFSIRRDFGNEHWNMEPWLNNIEYGPGVRLSLGKLFPELEFSLHLYTEILKIYYFARVDSKKYINQSDNDFHIGISLWLPIGATKGSKPRH